MHPDVHFLIGTLAHQSLAGANHFISGGDGPKIIELEQMREKHQALLADRIELLGSIKHEDVRDVRGECSDG